MQIGTRLGPYQIIESIGAGGMGEIYKGHNIQTGDLVAIKVMLPELAENAAAMALFRKEASALHSLYHEAIVRYYVFTVEPVLQRPYLAMEFVEGTSLRNLLLRNAVLYPGRALRETFRKVGAAMRVFHDSAHASGVMLVDELAENARRVTEGSGYLVQVDREKIMSEVDSAKMRVRSQRQLPLIRIHNDWILRNIMITDNGYPYIVDLDSMRAPDNSRWYDVTCFLINLESQIKYWPIVRAGFLMDMWENFWQGYSGKELPDGLSESEIWPIIYLIKVEYLFGGTIRPPLFEVYGGVLGSCYVRQLKKAVKRGEFLPLSLGGWS